MEGCMDRDGVQSSPGAAGLGGFPEEQLPPRAPRPLIGRGRAAGDPSANEVGARTTQG